MFVLDEDSQPEDSQSEEELDDGRGSQRSSSIFHSCFLFSLPKNIRKRWETYGLERVDGGGDDDEFLQEEEGHERDKGGQSRHPDHNGRDGYPPREVPLLLPEFGQETGSRLDLLEIVVSIDHAIGGEAVEDGTSDSDHKGYTVQCLGDNGAMITADGIDT